jgi:hypothetical protein
LKTVCVLLISKLAFIDMLNLIRYGMLTYADINTLQHRCSIPVKYNDDVKPTISPLTLNSAYPSWMYRYPLREAVDEANQERFQRLSTPLDTFEAIDSGPAFLLAKCLADSRLQLCAGAPRPSSYANFQHLLEVMLIKKQELAARQWCHRSCTDFFGQSSQ